MAMIARGQVLAAGKPQDAIELLRSRVWRRRVDDAQLDEYQRRFAVLSTRLVAGKLQINVYAETQPDEGFVMVEPDLEDVYFLQLRSTQPNAAVARGA
jgi:hypothetical protein